METYLEKLQKKDIHKVYLWGADSVDPVVLWFVTCLPYNSSWIISKI